MTLKEVFELAAQLGDFPTVEIDKPIKHHPNKIGKINQIRPDGVSVDFGAGWNKWFHAKHADDKRSHYMNELKPVK